MGNFYRQQPLCLGLIPARGGSKGVHRKNIRQICGKPLLAYTIEVALNTPNLDRVIVTTDDIDIANVARAYGAEVPFVRPEKFAKDDTPDLPVYQHAISWLRKNEDYEPDIVVWLRPTAPLRSVEDIQTAIRILIESKADCVRSVCEVEHHPYWMMRLDEGRLKPFIDDIDIMGNYYSRQLLPSVYRLNGVVDVSWCKQVLESGNLYVGDMRGYVMPAERSIDIDNEFDMSLVELLLSGEHYGKASKNP